MNIQGPLTKLSFLQILKSTRSNFCFFIHIFHCLSFQWFDLIWLKRLGAGGLCNYSGPLSAGGKLGRWRRVVVGRRWHQDQSDFSTEIQTRHWYWKTNGFLSFISPKGLSSPFWHFVYNMNCLWVCGNGCCSEWWLLCYRRFGVIEVGFYLFSIPQQPKNRATPGGFFLYTTLCLVICFSNLSNKIYK